ncbi:MAG: CotH kinase family protein, partial [Flavobacteriales bacterium]|nr:CotH kinase family protein [Flavobacteriales bacterium]
ASEVSLEDYWLGDDIDNPYQWQFPSGTLIPAGGYLVVLLTGRGAFDPNYLDYLNTNFLVTQTNEEAIVFSDPDGNILETYDFSVLNALQENHAWVRIPDGTDNWMINDDLTPGEDNLPDGYVGYATPVNFSHVAGYYDGSIELTLTSSGENETIYYTVDGSDPTEFSILYSEPLSLDTTTCVRAITISEDPEKLPGFIQTSTFFFGEDLHTLPVVAVSGTLLSNGQWAGQEKTDLEYFAPGGELAAMSHGKSNEHGNDSNAYDQRGFDYITCDSRGYDHGIAYPLFHHSNRDKFERLIFKSAGNDNFPFSDDGAHMREALINEIAQLGHLDLDGRRSEPVVVYLNGNYHGVYWMHEKMDDTDYFNYYYDQPRGYVDVIKTWGGTWFEYGNGIEWMEIAAFIVSNDMADESNFSYVETQVDLGSLADFFILNSYVVNAGWLNWDHIWWRGRHECGNGKKWRYGLWDLDATFGHYINYSGIPDTGPTADPCFPETLGDIGAQLHVPALVSLLENPDFACHYTSRYHQLASTLFSCDQMIGVVDSMAALIDPEMSRQVQRWDGDYALWLESVQELRDFILARCDENFQTQLDACYPLTPSQVTIYIDGPGAVEAGLMQISSSASPDSLLWCEGNNFQLTALSENCSEFIGWEVLWGDVDLADSTAQDISFPIDGSAGIQANFAENTGTYSLTLGVSPIDAGGVVVNGTLYTDLPTDIVFEPGESIEITAVPDAGHDFIEWAGTGITIMDETTQQISVCTCSNATLTAFFDPELSIPSYNQPGFQLMPNPASDQLIIKANSALPAVEIFDITGRRIILDPGGKIYLTIDVSSFASGIYLAKVGGTSLRFCVEK